MKKQRKLVVGFLLLLALVVSGFTYAYWAGGILAPADEVVNDNSVKIGEGHNVETSITVSAQEGTKGLVPTVHKGEEEDADKETLTFAVTWAGIGSNAEDAVDTEGTLVIEITNILIDEKNINGDGLDEKEMFVIVVVTEDLVITAGTVKTIDILVTFAVEPKDLATYELVANKEVTFTVTFKVITTP